MINVMFDNGFRLSIPGYKVRVIEAARTSIEAAKTSHVEITGPDGEFYHINYNKILFIETLEDENK